MLSSLIPAGRRRRACRLALFLLVFLVPSAPVPAQPALAPEAAVVDVLQNGLIENLENPAASASRARSAALGALIAETFDINAMGAVAVGIRNYQNWTRDQKTAFLDAFARFLVATHSSRFEGVKGQRFEIEGSEDAQSGRKLVHARYFREGHDPVQIDYLVQNRNGDWRVLDVYLDGTVSLLALHRAEFASVLRDRGFDNFIAAMHAKADQLDSRRATN